MAAEVLLALLEVGAVLWVEAGRLRFRAPEGAVGEALRGRAGACRPALVALVEAGAVLSPDLAGWPEEARESFEERAGICEFEGGLPRAEAEVEAERCFRVEHARAFLARAGMGGAP